MKSMVRFADKPSNIFENINNNFVIDNSGSNVSSGFLVKNPDGSLTDIFKIYKKSVLLLRIN